MALSPGEDQLIVRESARDVIDEHAALARTDGLPKRREPFAAKIGTFPARCSNLARQAAAEALQVHDASLCGH